jgi:hypothetical protein
MPPQLLGLRQQGHWPRVVREPEGWQHHYCDYLKEE